MYDHGDLGPGTRAVGTALSYHATRLKSFLDQYDYQTMHEVMVSSNNLAPFKIPMHDDAMADEPVLARTVCLATTSSP